MNTTPRGRGLSIVLRGLVVAAAVGLSAARAEGEPSAQSSSAVPTPGHGCCRVELPPIGDVPSDPEPTPPPPAPPPGRPGDPIALPDAV